MKKIILIASLIFLALLPSVQAGLWLEDNGVVMKPFEEKKLCIGIWEGTPGTTFHTVGFTENILPFIAKIEPNGFDLDSINAVCESEQKSRQECIKDLCRTGQYQYCRFVCTTFKVPLVQSFSWNTSEVAINGGVRDVMKAGVSEFVHAYDFNVYYTPYPMLWLIGGMASVIVVILIIAIFLIFRRRKTSKNTDLISKLTS